MYKFLRNVSAIILCAFILTNSFAQPAEQWLSKINGRGDFSDKFNAIAIDNSGNVYLAGYTIVAGNSRDVLTLKLNPAGDTLWSQTFNGSGGGVDEANANFVDDSGNVYVTGYQDGSGTGDDIITIKYSTDGLLLWSAVFNYTANENDKANTINVDASGNVFVAGECDSDPSSADNKDIIIVKYNNAGVEQWAQRYNGTGSLTNKEDEAAKVITDSNGNAYIAGRTYNGTNEDFITIKYTASGVQEWINIYNGGKGDRAVDIVSDAAGNLYVAGRSKIGADDDYLTIKYSPSGAQLWKKSYDGTGQGSDRPVAMTIDANAVYITGQSDTDLNTTVNNDYTTIKYNLAGAQLWAVNFNGTGKGDDIPTAIAVDGSGNVVVTGQSDGDAALSVLNNDFATVKYNSSGIKQWSKTLSGNAGLSDVANDIAINSNSDIYITGSYHNSTTLKDGVTVKYSSGGNQDWVKKYAGAGDNSDNVNGITADVNGYVYIAGYTVEEDMFRNMCTAKITINGGTEWVRSLDGTSNKEDQATAVAADNKGNVYATGYTRNSGTGTDFTTIKYNPAGDTLWVRKYNNPAANGNDKAYAIAVDASGNVYVTGESDSNPTDLDNDDFLTIKYNANGDVIWIERYNDPAGNGTDEAVSVKIGATGVYVCGKSFNDINEYYVTIKYNFTGGRQWLRTYDGGNGDSRPVGMTLDANENVIVTGSSRGANGKDDDIATVKYNAGGEQLWVSRYNGSGDGDDEVKGIAVDDKGAVFLCGYVDSDASVLENHDFITLKYDSMGFEKWAVDYNGDAGLDDIANVIALDDSGNVFVSGESDFGSVLFKNNNYTTIKYSSGGIQKWLKSYNGKGNASDVPGAMAVYKNYVYVSGGSVDTQKDIVTINYPADGIVGIKSYTNNENGIKVYPNPFSDYVTIDLTESQASRNGDLAICITDVVGKEIKKITHISEARVVLQGNDFSKGMYIYTIKLNGENIGNGKLVIQ